MSSPDLRVTSRDHGGTRTLRRSMSFGANVSLGFTYLSPLTGVYSLFALGLATGGPLSVWWLLIAGVGQLLVALVFGEVVSQFPIAGGLYPWARRLWGRRYAWMVAWIYLWAAVVSITAIAEYASGFLGNLLGLPSTPLTALGLTLALLVVSLLINSLGTRTLARVAQIGLVAEFVGVAGIGIYLILFDRVNPVAILWGGGGFAGPGLSGFLGAALAGLFLFYGFEACGNVAEEVRDAPRQIPKAMILTLVIGEVAALLAYAGFMLAAPDLPGVIAGTVEDPIDAILTGALGEFGAKVFLVVAVTAFLSCIVSLQASLSRLIFSFGRDTMLPGSRWLAHLSRSSVPANATLVCSLLPAVLGLWAYLAPNALALITSFAVLAIYVCFQMVVLAALRQRIRGWRPAGVWSLGRAGFAVNVAALVYGIFAMVLLIRPAAEGSFLERYTVLIGLGIVVLSGLGYMGVAAPYGRSPAPSGDAREHAAAIRAGARDGYTRPVPTSHRAR